MEAQKLTFKLFDLYDVSNIEVRDVALKPYISFEGKLLTKMHGRNLERFAIAKTNLIERLANRIAVPGHVGKGKHKIITNWASGKYNRNMKTVLQAMESIAKKTGKNPYQVLVTAIENGAPRDEVTVIEQAGARYPQAVGTSPMRRINLAIRWIVQGSYTKSFGKKRKMADSLADEIVKASEGSMESFAVSKKSDSEKQADGAR